MDFLSGVPTSQQNSQTRDPSWTAILAPSLAASTSQKKAGLGHLRSKAGYSTVSIRQSVYVHRLNFIGKALVHSFSLHLKRWSEFTLFYTQGTR